jgi:hypothetical protein
VLTGLTSFRTRTTPITRLSCAAPPGSSERNETVKYLLGPERCGSRPTLPRCRSWYGAARVLPRAARALRQILAESTRLWRFVPEPFTDRSGIGIEICVDVVTNEEIGDRAFVSHVRLFWHCNWLAMRMQIVSSEARSPRSTRLAWNTLMCPSRKTGHTHDLRASATEFLMKPAASCCDADGAKASPAIHEAVAALPAFLMRSRVD